MNNKYPNIYISICRCLFVPLSLPLMFYKCSQWWNKAKLGSPFQYIFILQKNRNFVILQVTHKNTNDKTVGHRQTY